MVKFGEFIMILELHPQGLNVAPLPVNSASTVRRSANISLAVWSRRPMVLGRAGRRAPSHSCRICANGLPPFLASPRYGCGAK